MTEVTKHWGDARVNDYEHTHNPSDVTPARPDFYWEGSSTQKVFHDSMGTATITINSNARGGSSYVGAGIVDAAIDSVSYHIRYDKIVLVPQILKDILINAGYDVS